MSPDRQKRFDDWKFKADIHGTDGDRELELECLAAMNEMRLSENLAGLVKRLVLAVRKSNPDSKLARDAMGFLVDHKLINILRKST